MRTTIVSTFCSFVLLTRLVQDQQSTGIHAAAQRGDVARVRALLDRDSLLVNAADSAGWTPLHFAAQRGYLGVAELLLKRGANVSARLRQGGGTPLHVAATTNHTGIAELLLSRGARATDIDDNEWTALHRAAVGGHREVAEVLLAHGASVFAWSNTGVTPIDQAAEMRHVAFVKLLRERGSTALPTTDSFPGECRWVSGENATFSFGCEDGAYRMRLKVPGPVHIHQNFGWRAPGVSAEVDAAVESGRGLEPTSGTLLGLGCLSDRNTGYVAILGTNGTWGIMRLNRGFTQLWGSNPNTAIRGLARTNRLRIDCSPQGGKTALIGFYVNGQMVGSVEDDAGFVEYSGVALYADTFPGVVAFTKFAARRPSDEGRN